MSGNERQELVGKMSVKVLEILHDKKAGLSDIEIVGVLEMTKTYYLRIIADKAGP